MKFQTTSPVALVSEIDLKIKAGWLIVSIGSRLQWVSWRYVRIYFVEFSRLPAATLKLDFGPVSERPLPELSEGVHDVYID